MQIISQNLTIRRPQPEDVEKIIEIASDYKANPLPDKWVSAAVVESVDGVIAFGVIRNHAELLFYGTGRFRELGGSLTLLMNQALKECKDMGMDQVYIYADSEEFAQVLMNRFGFSRSTLIPMFKDL